MPIAATTQSVAAVVRPRTDSPCRMIAPAPRKPIPVTIWAAIRVGSARTMLPPETRKSRNPYAPAIVKSAAPTETSMCVRNPASRSRSSRSIPTAPPSAAATTSRRSASAQCSAGTLDASSIESLFLRLLDRRDPGRGKVEQLVQARAVERRPLGRRLHLHQPAFPGHHDVAVDLLRPVLRVSQVEQ